MQVNIREIDGNWNEGYVLHKHSLSSKYTGDDEHGHPTFETLRSDPGEALFQLKYRGQSGETKPLAKALFHHVFPRFDRVDVIVPMPASNPRKRQPVDEIANELSALAGIPVIQGLLVKAAGATPLKT